MNNNLHNEILTNDNYLLYAAKNYENVNSMGTKEFYEDLERIIYIKRVFNKYLKTNELQYRLILNHLTVLYNVFNRTAINRILFLKLDKYHSILKPFLVMLNTLPEVVININNNNIYINDIEMDEGVIRVLRTIKR